MRLPNLSLSLSWPLHYLHIHVLLYFCIFIMCSSAISSTISPSKLMGNETDKLSLLALKSKISDGPLQFLSSWNESLHFCEWYGVLCSHGHQRVTTLNLGSLQLMGSISPFVGNMSFLRVLNLRNNSFSHVIPPELGRLKRLESLLLQNNSFGGEIPGNLSACSKLRLFSISYNSLVGKIPAVLGSLSKLEKFHLAFNNLRGEIPLSLGNSSSLQEFYAAENSFSGTIPDSLCRLTNLTYLGIGGNLLSGEIPSPLFNHSSIATIDVAVNQIQGSFPPGFGNNLPNLQFFGIAFNHFFGSIPVSISNATNLVFLLATTNNLIGKVPSLGNLLKLRRIIISHNNLGSGESDDMSFLSSLSNATGLEILNLNQNNFGGFLPESVGNLSTSLLDLSLSNNHFSGNIPTGIFNLVNLEGLYMAANQFTGNIPLDIGKLQNLKQSGFQENRLSGNIPYSFGNLTLLSKLVLDVNFFDGEIPSSFGKCQSLVVLDLGQNNLSGPIPKELYDLSSLSIGLSLSQNHLTGSLPMEIGNLKNLGYFDVSENMLSGEIPVSLGSCERLETLRLEGNFFQGEIPSTLSTLRGIQYLDLSRNNLSGKIPGFLEEFRALQNLNLSFNNFDGTVPREGIFKNASAISVTGNSRLCGGIPELHLPICSFKESKKRRSIGLIIGISCGLLGITLMLSFLYLCWFRKKRKVDLFEDSPKNSKLKVTYQSLLKATNGFSLENLIGVGSFGSVYKGTLEPGGEIIAVKVLNLSRHGASKSFIAECKALRNIRHRNLVKVLTACSGIDFRGNEFKALVYEFMVNGSLEEWLHPSVEDCPKLNFIQRVNIAIDLSCALDYLHNCCERPIIHCDLKPSNVLLDKEITAHVGDFGLARFFSVQNHNFSTSQTSSIGVRGTIGYTAPGFMIILCIAKYGMGSEVSTYGDIYSFGILLLEMFTGKRPTDDMFKDSLNLHNFVKVALPDRVAEISDPTLLEENKELSITNHNQNGITSHEFYGCLISIFGIGIACSSEFAKERTSIGDVIAELNSVKNILIGSGTHEERETMRAESNQEETLLSEKLE